MQIGKVVSDMLLLSFKTAPLKSLYMVNSVVWSNGMNILVSALEAKAAPEVLQIIDNCIESEYDTITRTAMEHPKVCLLQLNYVDWAKK